VFIGVFAGASYWTQFSSLNPVTDLEISIKFRYEIKCFTYLCY